MLEFLPGYAPELNPVEYLWSYWEQHELPNFCPQSLAQLSFHARRACLIGPCGPRDLMKIPQSRRQNRRGSEWRGRTNHGEVKAPCLSELERAWLSEKMGVVSPLVGAAIARDPDKVTCGTLSAPAQEECDVL